VLFLVLYTEGWTTPIDHGLRMPSSGTQDTRQPRSPVSMRASFIHLRHLVASECSSL